jgi:hypothetical protein
VDSRSEVLSFSGSLTLKGLMARRLLLVAGDENGIDRALIALSRFLTPRFVAENKTAGDFASGVIVRRSISFSFASAMAEDLLNSLKVRDW